MAHRIKRKLEPHPLLDVCIESVCAKLYEFQIDGINYALHHHYSINACDMGLGKTVQAIAVIAGTKLPATIICPAYLKQNWKNEIRKFSRGLSDNVRIYSYNALLNGIKIKRGMLVFDEAHYLKNITAKRTKVAHKLVEKLQPDRLMLLTGTPMKNRVAEFYSLLRLCSMNPHQTSGKPIPEGYMRFARYFSYEDKIPVKAGFNISKFYGLRNGEELLTYMSKKYFRRLTKDAIDLPKVIRKPVCIEETSAFDSDLLGDFENNAGNISKMKANSAYNKSLFTKEYLIDLLEEVLQVVVFTDHIKSGQTIKDAMSKKKIPAVFISGSTPVNERQKLVDWFQNKQIRVLIGTIGAMSTGFNLTSARHVVFNDKSWVPGDNFQAEKRIHRIGQTETCFVHEIYMSRIDQWIGKTLTEKIETISHIT